MSLELRIAEGRRTGRIGLAWVSFVPKTNRPPTAERKRKRKAGFLSN